MKLYIHATPRLIHSDRLIGGYHLERVKRLVVCIRHFPSSKIGYNDQIYVLRKNGEKRPTL